jgi:uncharacterized membrane protein YphA (DoxX/SURF4 family)
MKASRFAHNGLASFKGERACVATTSAPRPVANASNLTDIPPPPPETPIILLVFAALAGAVLTAVGYVVQRAALTALALTALFPFLLICFPRHYGQVRLRFCLI